jgi:hypothetical protein
MAGEAVECLVKAGWAVAEPEPNPSESTADQSKPEGLLYHYTDQKGLLGILESRNIWATHVRYLNDSSEFTLGWDKSWEKLLEQVERSEYPHKEQIRRIYGRIRRLIASSPEHSMYFVWCLTDDAATEVGNQCFDGDRLSQWRAYSGIGHGFSLGFDAAALEGCFSTKSRVVYRLGRCEYDEMTQNAMIESLASRHLNDFLEKWKIYFRELRDPSLSTFENLKKNLDHTIAPVLDMYTEFIQFGAFMKHRGFQEENEWRYVFVSEKPSDCLFRESRFGLTPYLPVGLDFHTTPMPLKRIVVGPGPHRNEWVETAKLKLAKCEISGVDVIPSDIPYRNW